MNRKKRRGARNAYGGSISEFGPALALLLICFFFPLVDLISIGISYCSCMLLNDLQVHEAALIPWKKAKSATGPVRHDIPLEWMDAGVGKFVKVQLPIKTKVSYRTGQAGDKIVAVSTTVTCSPFLPIPVPVANVPGLNGPMTFNITSERTMENPDYGD